MGQFDVIGIGRAVMDSAVLLDSYPLVDSKTEALDRFHGAGSPVPNALGQLAVWGWRTALVAGVGEDDLGSDFLEEMTSCSVNVDHVTRREGQATPQAFIWVERGTGKRTVVLDRALAPLSPDEVPSKDISNARFLLADGYEANANLAAMRCARDAGVQVLLDAGAPREEMDQQLALSDWIIVPVSFARSLFGDRDLFEVAAELKARGARAAVVTNGAGGSVAAWEGGVEWFRSYPVEVVDTTGAGDVFHAGFLHGLLKGWTVPECIRWAAASAALSLTALGGRGRLPEVGEVESLLREQGEALPES